MKTEPTKAKKLLATHDDGSKECKIYNDGFLDGIEWGYKEAMRYLITTNIQPPFLSNWFDAENHFNADVGMVVYDLAKGVYTTDGEKWEQIKEDHL